MRNFQAIWQTRVEESEAEPDPARPQDEPQTLRHIEIVGGGNGERVITAIEFLSPANKVSCAVGRIML